MTNGIQQMAGWPCFATVNRSELQICTFDYSSDSRICIAHSKCGRIGTYNIKTMEKKIFRAFAGKEKRWKKIKMVDSDWSKNKLESQQDVTSSTWWGATGLPDSAVTVAPTSAIMRNVSVRHIKGLDMRQIAGKLRYKNTGRKISELQRLVFCAIAALAWLLGQERAWLGRDHRPSFLWQQRACAWAYELTYILIIIQQSTKLYPTQFMGFIYQVYA